MDQNYHDYYDLLAYDRAYICPEDRSYSLIKSLLAPNRLLLKLVGETFRAFRFDISDNAIYASEALFVLMLIYYSLGVNLFEFPPATFFAFHILVGYAIILLIALDIVTYSIPKLRKLFNPDVKAEQFVKEIQDGSITPEEAKNILRGTTFSADNLSRLITDLNKEGILTPTLQEAIFDSQDVRFNNLRLLFGGDYNIRLDPEITVKLLKKSRNMLTEIEILNVYKKNPEDYQVIATLLATQQSAYQLLKKIDLGEKGQLDSINNYLEDKKTLFRVAFSTEARVTGYLIPFILLFSYIAGLTAPQYWLLILLGILITYILSRLVLIYLQDMLFKGMMSQLRNKN